MLPTINLSPLDRRLRPGECDAMETDAPVFFNRRTNTIALSWFDIVNEIEANADKIAAKYWDKSISNYRDVYVIPNYGDLQYFEYAMKKFKWECNAHRLWLRMCRHPSDPPLWPIYKDLPMEPAAKKAKSEMDAGDVDLRLADEWALDWMDLWQEATWHAQSLDAKDIGKIRDLTHFVKHFCSDKAILLPPIFDSSVQKMEQADLARVNATADLHPPAWGTLMQDNTALKAERDYMAWVSQNQLYDFFDPLVLLKPYAVPSQKAPSTRQSFVRQYNTPPGPATTDVNVTHIVPKAWLKLLPIFEEFAHGDNDPSNVVYSSSDHNLSMGAKSLYFKDMRGGEHVPPFWAPVNFTYKAKAASARAVAYMALTYPFITMHPGSFASGHLSGMSDYAAQWSVMRMYLQEEPTDWEITRALVDYVYYGFFNPLTLSSKARLAAANDNHPLGKLLQRRMQGKDDGSREVIMYINDKLGIGVSLPDARRRTERLEELQKQYEDKWLSAVPPE